MGESSITVLCCINGNIINAPNVICYNSPPSKVVLVRSNTTFNDLVACLSQVLCKDSSQVKLKLVYGYPINLGDGSFNFVALPINDNDDLSLMFNVATKFPPSHIVELYVEILSVQMENVDSPLNCQLMYHLCRRNLK